MVINMDESPYYWEYLPGKVVAPKLAKQATGWKQGYHHSRSTLILGVSANGTMLRPALVVKSEKRYTLWCKNEIDMLIMNSSNGWVNEELVIEWLKKILLPYVGKEKCLLLWDSFESHISDRVLSFLQNIKTLRSGLSLEALHQKFNLLISQSINSLNLIVRKRA